MPRLAVVAFIVRLRGTLSFFNRPDISLKIGKSPTRDHILAKKAISIICTQLGYYNRELVDIKVVDGEEFNLIMDPLSDPDVISIVENVLNGKDIVVVMANFTKEGEESEEEPEVEEPENKKPEREKNVKEDKPKKGKDPKPSKKKKGEE